MRYKKSIPGAKRTWASLRQLGYDLNSSVADLVDNALTERVGSKNIEIFLGLNRNYEISFWIRDDGIGMSSPELEEAMRVGADAIYENGDLGKFGMGMKTASLSHCNILTVVSKKEGCDLTGFSWNMGYVGKKNDWLLGELEKSEILEVFKKCNRKIESTGTIVLWEQLFQLSNDYNRIVSDKLAQNYLFRISEKVKLHLRMVFHRFLDSSIKSELTLTLNGEKLQPWDPFCRNEKNTQEVNLNANEKYLYLDNAKDEISIKGYVLPSKEGFSSLEAWKEGKGLLSWNDAQGYYIYRSNRLIRFGGWHGTKAKDEHDKLARISIDVDPSLDGEFRLNVNKSKIEFPELLFQHLKQVVNPKVIRLAKKSYRKEPEKQKVNNKVRSNKKLQEVSEALLAENQIASVSNSQSDGMVDVKNLFGSWSSNRLKEFLKYGNEEDFEIVSDHIDSGRLWKLVFDPNNKFKLIINSSHPFYSIMYGKGVDKKVTEALDALIFSLAFGEMYNINDQNAHLFNTYNTVASKVLDKLIKEKIL